MGEVLKLLSDFVANQPSSRLDETGLIQFKDKATGRWISLVDLYNIPDWVILEGDKKMERGMYLCWVVDTEDDFVVWSTGFEPFAADGKEQAHMKAIQKAGAALTKELEVYSFGLLRVVELPPKKEVQKVQLISAEDEG